MKIDDLDAELRGFEELLNLPRCALPPAFHFTESVDMVGSEALLVKGDNLRAVLGMLEEQGPFADFIYIDPPYNTGSNFLYADARLTPRSGLWGRHTDWMSFMLPRLLSGREALRSGGVFAASIDDYEYPRLKILLDAVFGEGSCLGTLVVCRSKNGKGARSNVAVNHEYVLLYGRTDTAALLGLEELDTQKYDREDEFGRYTLDGLFRKKGDASLRTDRPKMYYALYCSADGTVSLRRDGKHTLEVFPVDSKGVERRWLWGAEKAASEAWRLYASPKGVVYVKNYDREGKRVKIRSILDHADYTTDKATVELKALFGEKVFDTPKPHALIRDLINCCSGDDAVVLDYFAGSGTTAHAAFDLNISANARRAVILVEDVQRIPGDHLARKLGFEFTSDITQRRLELLAAARTDYRYKVIGVE